MDKNKNKLPETIEEAFQMTGRPVVDFSNVPEDLREYIEVIYQGVVITESINKGWKPDWDNWSQLKWSGWFNMSASAFGFGGTRYDGTVSGAGSGSRLVNFDEKSAKYSSTQFPDVWKKIQIG